MRLDLGNIDLMWQIFYEIISSKQPSERNLDISFKIVNIVFHTILQSISMRRYILGINLEHPIT